VEDYSFKSLSLEDKIRKARIQLLRRYPFWGHVCMYLNLKFEPGLRTLGVDAEGNLYYGEKLAVEVDEEEMVGMVAHEVFHVVDGALMRLEHRNPTLWNLAADAVSNHILMKNNFRLPKGSVDESVLSALGVEVDLEGKVTEQIYELLKREAQKQTRQQRRTGKVPKDGLAIEDTDLDVGGNKWETHNYTKSSEMTPSQKESIKRKFRKAVTEAVEYAKQQGSCPAGLEQYVSIALETPPYDWRTALNQFITRVLPSDFSYIVPSKKSPAVGVYMPHLKREEVEGVVALDTSGSIGGTELSQFKAQILRILQSFENVKLTVYECDAAVQQKYLLEKTTVKRFLNMKVKGRGGTDFTKVFEDLHNKRPNFLIYFTDGYGTYPSRKPNFPVMWVLTAVSIDPKHIPFGRVTRIWSNSHKE